MTYSNIQVEARVATSFSVVTFAKSPPVKGACHEVEANREGYNYDGMVSVDYKGRGYFMVASAGENKSIELPMLEGVDQY